jgi:hypothetical protein
MAIVFDMSSGKIQSESAGVTRVTDHLDLPSNSPALQQACITPEGERQSEAYLNHIREILKKL